MSIEIILYPKRANKVQLKRHLLSCGFTPCEHLWDWPAGSVTLEWYDVKDYRSITGVEATVFPLTRDQQKTYKCCSWALHTRTTIAASSFDLVQQNYVIKSARKLFSGSFYNDWYGTNKYTPVESDGKTPSGRGIFLLYNEVEGNLRKIIALLPAPLLKEEGDPGRSLLRLDPMRVMYNALVPFVVAALERFFHGTFKILCQYDKKAQNRLKERSTKVEFSDVYALSNGQKKLEDIVAQSYSFQNFANINKAMKDWFDIDIWKIFRKRKKVGKRIVSIDEQFNKIIEFRHGIVHRFDLDANLSRDRLIEILNSAIIIIELFVDYLEKDRGIIIKD